MKSAQIDAMQARLDQWMGTPFHHKACVVGVGVDCAHLIADVFHSGGAVPVLDLGEYPADWMLHRSAERFREFVERYADPVAEEQARPWDIVLMKHGRCFSHGAILTAPNQVVHAYVRRGVIRSWLNEFPGPFLYYRIRPQ